jgi:LCP family protein required for cell wall assembly
VAGRFYIFLSIVALIAIGSGVLVGVLNNRSDGVTAAPTQTPANPLLSATDDPSGATDAPVSTDEGSLSERLGNQDAVIAGLSEDEMVNVEDLNITSGLDENWMNILLLGSDARSLDETSRTDTMIICSVNTNTGEVKLTSIMRDMAVDFTDIGQYNGTYRINAANFFGGPELAMKTVNELFGMNIQYYAMVDFTSFSIIAEKLGGIDLTITEAEMEQINKNALQQAKVAYKAGIDETELAATNVWLETYGENTHLNGRQVLAYARIRKIDSDFSRAERQRTVLIALLDKVKTKNMLEVMGLSTDLFGYVRTNLSMDKLLAVATTVMKTDLSTIEQFRLPINNSYKQETRNEQSMLYDTDWQTNTNELYNFIYQ